MPNEPKRKVDECKQCECKDLVRTGYSNDDIQEVLRVAYFRHITGMQDQEPVINSGDSENHY